jgi:hypothetical protein
MPVIGFLNPGSASSNMYMADAFRSGLAEYGYNEFPPSDADCPSSIDAASTINCLHWRPISFAVASL